MIDLLEYKTDVAIRFGELQDSSLHARLLCRSRLYIVASPDYVQQKSVPRSVEDLSQHTLLGFSHPTHLNTWPIQLNDRHITVEPKIKASNGETVRQLALHGVGITCLSRFLVQEDLQAGRLQTLFEDQIELQYQNIHAVYYRQEHLPKRVHLFIEFLATKLAKYL